MASQQGKVTSFATELEATNQKTETRCTNIRKEVSKALSEQRQLLTSQAEAMSKKMDSVTAKVSICRIAHLSSVLCLLASACLPLLACLCLPLPACLYLLASACLFTCLSVCLPPCLCLSVFPFSCFCGDTQNQTSQLLLS